MAFEKGKSGNPKGRPAKGRALADILAKAGNTKIMTQEGKQITRKQLLADMLWQAATEGTVDFAGGSKDGDGPVVGSGGLVVIDSMQEWFTIAKFVHQHLDGPVRPEIEMPGGGNISFVLSVVNRRPEPEERDPDGDD